MHQPRPNATSIRPSEATGEASPVRLLVVDREPLNRDILPTSLANRTIDCREVRSVEQALAAIRDQRYDMAIIDPTLPDGCGLDLARQFTGGRDRIETLIAGTSTDYHHVVDAVRSGASDYLSKPLDPTELNERLTQALARQTVEQTRSKRVRKLQRICRELDQARQEVTDQVDTLCNDLVTAYQELAQQVQQVAQTSEFAAVARGELDLEELIRKSLEFMLQACGPTNGAMFLPSGMDEYTLGGYVNYDCAGEAADILLDHLADVVTPRVADRDAPLYLSDNDTLQHWLGDDWHYLADSNILAFPCRHDDETLAVMLLFRENDQPFDESMIELAENLGPMLGEYLARIVRIHHRHMPGLDPELDDDLPDGPLPF